MRFLVDECTGPAVARWLRDQSHDVFSVYDDARGMADDAMLATAEAEGRILITNDVACLGVIGWRLNGRRSR